MLFVTTVLSLLLGFTAAHQECTCMKKGIRPCEGMYVDYYYRVPYVGHPRDSQYLPPQDTVPEIIQRVTSIRDSIRDFLNTFDQQGDKLKKALWMRQSFEQVRHLLRAMDKAANSTTTSQV